MLLSKIIRVWDELHKLDTGEVGFCDLEKATEKVDGIKNDISSCWPVESK